MFQEPYRTFSGDCSWNPKLDGKQEAFLIALTCSTPLEGRGCWIIQLLADRVVEQRVVEGVSDETIWRTLKKIC